MSRRAVVRIENLARVLLRPWCWFAGHDAVEAVTYTRRLEDGWITGRISRCSRCAKVRAWDEVVRLRKLAGGAKARRR